MKNPALLDAIRARFVLDWDGIHGSRHWARVRANGLRLAAETGADVAVIEYFAVLHDSQRYDDGHDPAHGPRAAAWAAEIRDEMIHLDDTQFELLCDACSYHTMGKTDGDVTVQTCWDADRLDLGRVGIRPDPRYLCTDAAKDEEFIRWAYQRSLGLG